MNVTENLIEFLKYKGISVNKFSNEIGVSNSYFSKQLKENGSIGSKILQDIVKKYEEIDLDWLLTGKGGMVKIPKEYNIIDSNNFYINEPHLNHYTNTQKSIPLIPIDAMAGFGVGEMQIMDYDGDQFVVPTFKGAEFLIQVKGSSMHPKYSSGDIVACKKLAINDIFFQWNKVYVIDTEQGALIKRLKEGKDEEHVLIVSENDKYSPFNLHKSKINAISIVMGVIRLE